MSAIFKDNEKYKEERKLIINSENIRKDCGTDFYLVLTKEKNGKILLAYPAKITELHFLVENKHTL